MRENDGEITCSHARFGLFYVLNAVWDVLAYIYTCKEENGGEEPENSSESDKESSDDEDCEVRGTVLVLCGFLSGIYVMNDILEYFCCCCYMHICYESLRVHLY